MFDASEYFPRSIDSDHPSQSVATEPTPPDNAVSYDMVHKLTVDIPKIFLGENVGVKSAVPSEGDNRDAGTLSSLSPQLMIIFEDGDIDSALHFLIESVHNPFAPNPVAMVLVEEKVREEIVQRILPNLRPLSELVAEHPSFQESLEKARALNLELIRVADTEASPTFVCECNHDVLGKYPTGVTTFHTFRNNRDAIDICHREALTFASVSVWNENLDGCYEIVVALSCPHFFLNCINVDLTPISKQLKAERNYVAVDNGYHFETLHIYNQFKSIVFPIGELIWPSTKTEAAEPKPISFLEP